MAEPQTREQFKEYIMRRLGAPVQQINVDEDQVEDRIDDALAFFKDYHYLGSEKSYYVHTITQENITTKTIELPPSVIAVTAVLPAGAGGGNNFMSDQYQLSRDTYSQLNSLSSSMIPYHVAMTRLAEIDFWFSMTPSINFNKHKNLVTFNNTNSFSVGDKFVMEVQSVVDPAVYKKIWSDRWLKNYATALVKRQWGENLKPFAGVQLLGGINLDGASIYGEADSEISNLEEKMISSNSYAVLDEIG